MASSFSLFARPDASSSSDARTTADYRERAEAVLETKVPTRKRRSVPTSVSPSGLCDHPPVRKVWPCGLASTDKVGMMNGKATLTSCAALLILLAGCSDGTGPVSLYLMDADGSNAREVASCKDPSAPVRGNRPAWRPK